jgi:hypothetical protein
VVDAGHAVATQYLLDPIYPVTAYDQCCCHDMLPFRNGPGTISPALVR